MSIPRPQLGVYRNSLPAMRKQEISEGCCGRHLGGRSCQESSSGRRRECENLGIKHTKIHSRERRVRGGWVRRGWCVVTCRAVDPGKQDLLLPQPPLSHGHHFLVGAPKVLSGKLMKKKSRMGYFPEKDTVCVLRKPVVVNASDPQAFFGNPGRRHRKLISNPEPGTGHRIVAGTIWNASE